MASATAGPFGHRVLCDCLHNVSKWWWAASIILKVAAFLLGAGSILLAWQQEIAPYAVAGLLVLSELATYRSDKLKGMAQGLLRKIDLQDGFGWGLANDEYTDLLARCPGSVKRKVKHRSAAEPYFASKVEPGGRRALENLQEAAWWSKHLGEKAWLFCLWLLLFVVAASIALLIYTMVGISRQDDTPKAVARVVTSLLTLLPSVGLIRLILGYYGFAQAATKAEEKAKKMLTGPPPVNHVESVKASYEYYLARAAAPLIPGWIYSWNRSELNELWDKYRAACP